MMNIPHIIELFIDNSSKYPDQPAILENGYEITYKELFNLTDKLKYSLINFPRLGDSLCFVITNSSSSAIISMLGIFRAGKIYVPISNSLPDEAIRTLHEKYKPEFIITDSEKVDRVRIIFENIKVSILNIHKDLPEKNEGILKEKYPYSHEKPCYISFTSGSTGDPKGILGTFGGISHYIAWELSTLELPENPRVSQFSPYSFDVFFRDVFVALCSGGTVCVPPSKNGIIEIEKLTPWLIDTGVNLIHCVPTLLREWMKNEKQPTSLANLNYVLLAGEKLFSKDIELWKDLFGVRTKLMNIYGPSETSLAKFSYLIDFDNLPEGVIPIGKPIPGSKAILFDDRLNPTPPGEIGEIYIRTIYKTKGYYRNPKLTDKKFIDHPRLKEGEKIYKTGDLSRINSEGDFEILGRLDNQIKRRGIRIDLNAIENALLDIPLVRRATVIYDDGSENIAAFIDSNGKTDLKELRSYLLEVLPQEMVPLYYFEESNIPTNDNGKVDRGKLKEKVKLLGKNSANDFVAPKTEIELALSEIWSEVLSVSKNDVGIHDNFFELGGYSLQLIKIQGKIETKLDRTIDLLDLFKYPTINKLSTYLVNESTTTFDQISESENDLLDHLDEGLNLFDKDNLNN